MNFLVSILKLINFYLTIMYSIVYIYYRYSNDKSRIKNSNDKSSTSTKLRRIKMNKIRTSHELNIPGWGKISAGTSFKVERFNKRFIYVRISDRVELRLARKADCEVIY